MSDAPTRRSAGTVMGRATLVALVLTGLAACTSAPQPEVSVKCEPGSIQVEIRNVSDTTARYTVTIESTRDDLTESTMMSSNDVEPGRTATLEELRPDEPTTCRVTDVKVFEQ